MFNEILTTKSVLLDQPDMTGAINLSLTESGNITSSISGEISPPETIEESVTQLTGERPPQFHTFNGKTEDDVSVTLEKARISTDYGSKNESARVIDIQPSVVVFDSSPNDAFVGKEVTIEFDVMNFHAPKTWFPQSPDTPLLEQNQFVIQSNRLDDIEDRIELIKEYRRSIRTATISISQSVNSPANIQLEHALCTLERVIWLVAFVQGVLPAPIRASVTEVDGEEVTWTYEKWMTTWRSDIGHAFTGPRIDGPNDVRVFLEHGYDRFANQADRYRYRRCISWYLDALLGERTLNAKITSIAAGIETLAERYAAYNEDVGDGTHERIANLVDELGVNVDDLAAFSKTFEKNPEATKEYFYANSRNFALHNEHPDMPFDNIFTDYEASIVLFRRLLFHEFADLTEAGRYARLTDQTPTDRRFE